MMAVSTSHDSFLAALEEGAGQRPTSRLSAELQRLLMEWRSQSPANSILLRLLARQEVKEAQGTLLERAADRTAPPADRVAFLRTLGDLGDPEAVKPVLGLIRDDEPVAIQQAALATFQRLDSQAVSAGLVARWSRLSRTVRPMAAAILLSRKAWARDLINEVESGRISATEVPLEELHKVRLLGDSKLDELVRKFWGSLTSATPEEKLAEVRRLNNDLPHRGG